MCVIQAQPQVIIEKIVHHDISYSWAGHSKSTMTLKEAGPYAKQTKSITSQYKRAKFSQDSSYRWRLSLPHWITSEVLEVAGIEAPGGWNWYLRSYSIIPLDSDVSSYVMSGNIQKLQDMFAWRQASPFDMICLPNGNLFSLLEWVTRRNRNEMIAFLLDQGTDPNSLFDPPLWSKVSHAKTVVEVESLIPSMHLLFHHIDISYESDEQAAISVLGRFHGTPEEFLFLQQHVCPSFYRLPKRIRIRVAFRIGAFYSSIWFVPELISVILGTDVLDPNDFKFCQESNSTLIHCAARGMGASERDFQEGLSAERLNCDAWSKLCHEFLCVKIDIHDLVDGKTPFLSYLGGYLSSWYGPIELGPACQIAVQVWLKQLEVVGVDLNGYGKVEEYLWKKGITQREFSVWNVPEQLSELQGIYGFAYSSSPENWYIWLSEESDSFVGEFLNMIERPVEVMPGAWPKE